MKSSLQAFSLVQVLLWTASSPTNGYTPAHSPKKPALVGPQHMLKQGGIATSSERSRYHNTQLSQSVLASCDTLPSFPTAHGILSPETVLRMEELTKDDNVEAVHRFLTAYRRDGPMSCLSMLSDPDVLPHLTKAMRDIL